MLFIISLLSCLFVGNGIANDSIRISLLTCGQGEEVYSLYGHTAIRYQNFSQGIDEVYNYGMFDFGAPNFVFRFTLGETDYLLGKSHFHRFLSGYWYTGRDVYEQVLNLNQDEKVRLVNLLEENYRPENRIYRYNFFYDNCATRPRDKIEEAVSGQLSYAENMEEKVANSSFRMLLHKYTEGHPWARFGVDLCLGSRADEEITRREMMFVPFLMKEFFGNAKIINNEGVEKELVTSCRSILPRNPDFKGDKTFWISPMGGALLLLGLVIIVTLYEVYRQKCLWGIDFFLFFMGGVSGCILAFLAFFSQHPAVSPNYLLFVFHPFHLICLPWILVCLRKKRRSFYLISNSVVLTFFILLWSFFPQEFPLAVLPLALCLLIRGIGNVLIYRKR